MLIAAFAPAIACAIPMVATDTIAGQVTELRSGAAVASATVYVDSDSAEYWTTSDASGNFAISGLAPGAYNVRAEKDGFSLAGGSPLVTLNGTSSGPWLALRMLRASVQGTATVGSTLARNAAVYLYVWNGMSWTFYNNTSADAQGRYYFYDLSGGEFIVGCPGGPTSAGWVDPSYYESASTISSATSLSLNATSTQTADLHLTLSTPRLTGKVSKPDGKPASGAQVGVFQYNSGKWQPIGAGALAGADGSYAFYAISPGEYRVGAYLTQKTTIWTPSFYATGAPSASKVDSATSVAVDSSSTASGIDIVLSNGSETLVKDAYESDDTTPQAKPVVADGVVRDHTLFPAGDDDWMSFQVLGGHTYVIETTASTTLPMWSGDTDTYLTLYNSGFAKIAYNDDRPDDEGVLSRIEWTAPSTQTVYAHITDYGSACGYDSRAGAYGFQLRDLGLAQASCRIHGRVTDSETTQGVPSALVRLNDDSNLRVFTDEDGYYDMVGLAPGDYDLDVSADNHSGSSGSVTLDMDGDESVRDFVLVPAAEAKGTVIGGNVTSARGSVATATVTAVKSGSGETTTTKSNVRGDYSFAGIAPGIYSVTFSKAGYVSSTYTAVVALANRYTYRSTYLMQLGTVHGSITSSAGPLAGCSVVIDGAEATKTAADGSYSVGNVGLGVHTLKLAATGFAPYSQDFAIDDGDSLAVDRALATNAVAPTKPIVRRTPSKASLGYKRKRGRANFALGVNVRDVSGARLGSVLVVLQRSYDGKHWTKAYRLMTNASGTATKGLYATKKQTMYYRWVVTATSTHKQVVTAKQKVTIK
jgi:large repetitive protein